MLIIKMLVGSIEELKSLAGSKYNSVEVINLSPRRSSGLPNPLPERLKILCCPHNGLNLIPDLPPNIKQLNVEGNKLTSLPLLPKQLKVLTCEDNQISSLPIIPSSLRVIRCSGNNLPYHLVCDANCVKCWRAVSIGKTPLHVQKLRAKYFKLC